MQFEPVDIMVQFKKIFLDDIKKLLFVHSPMAFLTP